MIELLGFALVAFLFTGLYRWLALRFRWLDHPNQRSSHTAITPRGAGIIFALLITGAAAWFLRHQSIALLPLSGLIVALTGWWDDIRGASARVRLAFYLASSAAAVALSLQALHIASASELTTAVVIFSVLAILGLTWLTNLYNFMDGINGLAALEAVFVLLAVYFFASTSPYGLRFSQIHLFSCAALTGFVFWNFPAGKVFMGDAGSAFLGFFLGTLMLESLHLQGPSIVVWLILMGVFIADSGYTLLVRFATGQNIFAAHRLHGYQRLTAHVSGDHLRATSLLMAVNVLWLLPMAWLVHSNKLSEASGLLLAYTPIIAACYWLKAGIPRQGGV